jgi:hypothetical protein
MPERPIYGPTGRIAYGTWRVSHIVDLVAKLRKFVHVHAARVVFVEKAKKCFGFVVRLV